MPPHPDDIALCGIELAAGLSEWVQLMPLGRIEGRDGRQFRLEDAAAVIEATKALGMDLPIDYDHATDLAPAGTEARAAGWIREFEIRDDGIWGRVRWTERGAAAVEAGEYRYLSPVFQADKKTKRVIRILRAGLTNNPNLFLKAVASKGANMNELLKKLAGLLGLAEDSDEVAVCAAVESLAESGAALAAIANAAGLKEDSAADEIETAVAKAIADSGKSRKGEEKALAGIAKALGLAADADAAAIETAAAKATAEAAKAGDRDALATRLARLEDDTATARAEAAADAAIKAGKLTPAQRDWAIARAKTDPEDFETFLASQPVIVKPGSDAPGGKPKAGGELDDEDVAVARAMGLEPEAFRKTRDEEEAA